MPGLGKIGQIVVEITASNSKLKAGLAEASSAIRDWSLVVTGLTGGITNAFKTIADVGIKAVAVGLTALVGTFGLVAKTGAEFEDSMVRTFAILQESAGATGGDLDKLTDKAMEMGRDTLFSANQAAEGMQVLARAGFDTKEVLSGIKPVIDLAIVGNMESARASSIAAASMRGFGMDVSELGKVTDMLSKASTLANTTVDELGTAMGYVAPIARMAGMGYAETAAAIDVMSNAGIRGSKAGTTLRRMLSILLAPTGRAKKKFDELGLSFVDSAGKVDSLKVAIKKLEGAGLSASEIMETFSLRGGPGAAALLGLGSDAVDKFTQSIENSEGAADRMSQKFRTSVAGRMMDLKASVELLGLSFNEAFKEPLADTIFALRNYVNEIIDAWKESKVFQAVVDGVIKALSPLTGYLKKIASGFKDMLVALTAEDIGAFFENIRQKVEAFVKVIASSEFKTNIAAAFKGAKTVVMAFVNSIIMLGKLFNMLPDSVKPFIASLVAMGTMFTFLMGGIGSIISLFLVLGAILNFTSLKILATAAMTNIFGKTALTAAWNASILSKVFGALGAAGAWAGGAITVAWGGIVAFFTSVPVLIALAIAAVVAIGIAILKATGKWEGFKQGAIDAFNWVVEGIQKGIEKIYEFLAQFPLIKAAMDGIVVLAKAIWAPFAKLGELIKGIDFAKMGDGIKGFLKGMKEGFMNMFDGTGKKLAEEVNSAQYDPVSLGLTTGDKKTDSGTSSAKEKYKSKSSGGKMSAEEEARWDKAIKNSKDRKKAMKGKTLTNDGPTANWELEAQGKGATGKDNNLLDGLPQFNKGDGIMKDSEGNTFGIVGGKLIDSITELTKIEKLKATQSEYGRTGITDGLMQGSIGKIGDLNTMGAMSDMRNPNSATDLGNGITGGFDSDDTENRESNQVAAMAEALSRKLDETKEAIGAGGADANAMLLKGMGDKILGLVDKTITTQHASEEAMLKATEYINSRVTLLEGKANTGAGTEKLIKADAGNGINNVKVGN